MSFIGIRTRTDLLQFDPADSCQTVFANVNTECIRTPTDSSQAPTSESFFFNRKCFHSLFSVSLSNNPLNSPQIGLEPLQQVQYVLTRGFCSKDCDQ